MNQSQEGYYYPLGFNNYVDFTTFACFILGCPGIPNDTSIIWVGSSVTGQAHDKAGPFDRNGIGTSDYDIALISETLMDLAKHRQIHGSPSVDGTGELQDNDLIALGIPDLRTHTLQGLRATNNQVRPINFKIYRTADFLAGTPRLIVSTHSVDIEDWYTQYLY